MRTSRPFFLLFTNACILLIVMMMLMQSVVILQLLAAVDVLHGTVEVRSGNTNPFHTLHQGEFIRTGDTIRSGDDGTAELRWIDGTRLRVQPNTEITIRRCSMNLKKRSQNSEFNLLKGKVFVRIPQKLSESSLFSITTPTATATVRGTVFSVSADDVQTKVAVWKGRVEVADERGASLQAVPEGQLLSAGSQTWHLFQSSSRLAQRANGEFRPLSNIISPSLRARVIPNDNAKTELNGKKRARLVGRAEAGDRVLVDGQEVYVRGDGGFSYRINLKSGANVFNVTAIDRHDASRALRVVYTLK